MDYRFWISSVIVAMLLAANHVSAQEPKPDVLPPPKPVEGTADPLPTPPPPPAAPAAPLEESAPFGRGGSPWGGGVVGHAPLRADYRATWFPVEPVANQPTHLGYVEENFSFSFPIWQNAPDEWSASFHLRNETFQTHAIFPDSGRPFPEDLWNIHVATTYRHLLDNGWIAGGTLSVGSASDKPFNSINEMTAGVFGFLRVPQGDHNAWLFSLAYSSNSQLPIPIPGVAFVYQPNDWFRANIGLPFMVMVRPWDDWTFDFSYMLLTNVHARATYHAWGPLRLYLGYDWDNESYLLADRAEDRDRFFYYNQQLVTGARYDFSRQFSIDLSSGNVFDRFYFQGRSLSDRNQDRIDVGDGPFLSLQGQVRW